MVGTPIINMTDVHRIDQLEEDPNNEWKVTAGVLTYEGRIYVPKDDLLRIKVMSHFHDNPESGHSGASKTAKLVSGDFHCPAMHATIRRYIARCEPRHRIKVPRHGHHSTNMPLQPQL